MAVSELYGNNYTALSCSDSDITPSQIINPGRQPVYHRKSSCPLSGASSVSDQQLPKSNLSSLLLPAPPPFPTSRWSMALS